MKKQNEIKDYRHKETRKNNPPAGMASYEKEEPPKKKTYAYDPHLSPQLVWADKPGLRTIEVEDEAGVTANTVSLHVHERISTKAIIEAVSDKPKQMDFFGDPQLPLQEAIKFYQHDVDWTNRLILGDSLLVANSLIEKEMMAGKVQMIYMDPPYGIKYASNFQPKVTDRNVKEQDTHLTREPEMIKAYRDTWKLGIHSYLSFIRDRVMISRDLLSKSGSIIIQISNQNVHLVRNILDEIFGAENFVSLISIRRKINAMNPKYLGAVNDYLLFYAKNIKEVKFRKIYKKQSPKLGGTWAYVELPSGEKRRLTKEEIDNSEIIPKRSKIIASYKLAPAGFNSNATFNVIYHGKEFSPPNTSGGRSWKTNQEGMHRLIESEKVIPQGDTLRYAAYYDYFPYQEIDNVWNTARFSSHKRYVVETAENILERCILMTTDPGDIVFDPTCGSGTTAYVAEQFGRRWITCDTSRVSLAIARQRILTATYPFYKIDDDHNDRNPEYGFKYKTVPHITLKSIAQNLTLDSVFEEYNPKIQLVLDSLNKLANTSYKEYEVPFEPDKTWNADIITTFNKFHTIKVEKQSEINKMIAEEADQEILYNQPKEVRGITRVSGPFTVEAIPPPVYTADTPIGGLDGELETFGNEIIEENHIPNLLSFLQKDGITFPNNKHLDFDTLTYRSGGILHAEGEAEDKKYAISFGPQHGPVSLYQVEQGLREANLGGFDEIIFCGFAFDPEATSAINSNIHPKIKAHTSQIRPDIIMKDSEGENLLKTTSTSQLFTVFGEPDIEKTKIEDGKYVISLHGVDIYNPLDGSTHSENADKVAAWFIDTDYNGRTFCIVQAFFPDKSAWKKLEKALKGSLNEDRFDMLTGKESIPFKEGKYKKAAVKVIDQRGNEVMKVLDLD